MPIGYIHQPPVDEAIVRVQEALRPDVVRIRYSFADDWGGEPSIFFRVVLSDAASKPGRLGQTAERVQSRIMNEIRSDEYGLHAYFNFRSESEQLAFRDPHWA